MLIVCPNCTASYDVKPATLGAAGRRVRCSSCRREWTATSQQSSLPVIQPVAPPIQPVDAAQEPVLAPTFARAPSEATDVEDAAPEGESRAVVTIADAPETTGVSVSAAVEIEARPGAAAPQDIESFAARSTAQVPRRQRRSKGFLGLPPIGPPPITRTLIAVQLVAIGAILAWRSDIVRALPQTASLFRAIGLPVNLRGLVFSDVRTSRDDNAGVTVLVVEGTIENVTAAPATVPRLRFALRSAAGAELLSWTAPPDKPTLSPGETLPFRSRLASPPPNGHDVSLRFLNRLDFTPNGVR
jgi:predicted Zn finger-like uncharacterized protein